MKYSSYGDTVRKIAAAISKDYKIKVNLIHNGTGSAHTSQSTKEITVDMGAVYSQGEDYVIGLLLHEVAHIRFSPQQIDQTKISVTHPTIGGMIFNWLEDRRIDGMMSDEYGGAREFQQAVNTPANAELEAYMLKVPHSYDRYEREGEERKGIDPRVWRNLLIYATLEAEGIDMSTAFIGEDTGSLQDIAVDELKRIYKSTNKRTTPAEVLALAKQAMHALVKFLPLKDMPPHNKPQGSGGGEHEPHGKLGLGGKGSGSTKYQLVEDQFLTQADEDSRPQIAKLKKRLIAKLRDTEHQRFIGNQRRGRIDKKSLSRVARGNYRVYRQKIEKKGKKYAFTVVLDTSGSMFDYGAHPNIKTALQASITLIRSARGLGFPSSLVMFGSRAQVMLRSKEPYKLDVLHQRVYNSEGQVYQGGTDITAGISKGIETLRSERGHKILLLITDGSVHSSTKEQCRQLMANAAKHGIQSLIYYVGVSDQKILQNPSAEKSIIDASELIPATEHLLKSLTV